MECSDQKRDHIILSTLPRVLKASVWGIPSLLAREHHLLTSSYIRGEIGILTGVCIIIAHTLQVNSIRDLSGKVCVYWVYTILSGSKLFNCGSCCLLAAQRVLPCVAKLGRKYHHRSKERKMAGDINTKGVDDIDGKFLNVKEYSQICPCASRSEIFA